MPHAEHGRCIFKISNRKGGGGDIVAISFSFAIFIFLLALFETWHCCYFSLVLLLKKHATLICSILNIKELFSLKRLLLCLSSRIHFIGAILSKKYQKWGFGKKISRCVCIIVCVGWGGWPCWGISYRYRGRGGAGSKWNPLHTMS